MELSKAQRYATVMVMMLGAFIALLNQAILITAFPGIMTSFNHSLDSAQWLTTIFMLVNGIMIPISAYYTTHFASKSLYLTAIGLFILGTLLCLVAPYFWLLLLGRAVQAIGAGILIRLIKVVLLVAFPLEERGAAMGIFGLVTGFSPAIAGWILSYYSWQAIFVIVLVAMLINIVISIAVVKM
ncbi:MFS transporter [Streptococcus dysgalactiae]|uniref:MFS transporter n=1 Tax=Streptococcus dysgalactiae TaxID=1334 RepID=UPI003D7154FF